VALVYSPPADSETAKLIGYKASVLVLYADEWGRDEYVHHFFLTREEARAWVAERRQCQPNEFPRPARISPVYSTEATA
jgi:hypothetical protein